MRRGVTLVELMIATALGIMLIGIAALMFTQSQHIFMETNARVSLAVQMRSAIQQLGRDLSLTVNTGDLEFFLDGDGDGHYSPGEDVGGQEPLPAPCGSANVSGYTQSMGLCTATYTRTSPPLQNPYRADALCVRVEPGLPLLPYVVEYRLQTAGPSVQFVRRVIQQDTSGTGVTASTEVLLSDVVSLSFEFQAPGGAWVDATAASALGLRSVTAATGSVVEMCFEGAGTLSAGVLRVPNTSGMAALQPGDPIRLYGASPAVDGDFTIEDLKVQGSDALISFEERLVGAGSNAAVRWRAPSLPPAIRAQVSLRSRNANSTVSVESVLRLR